MQKIKKIYFKMITSFFSILCDRKVFPIFLLSFFCFFPCFAERVVTLNYPATNNQRVTPGYQFLDNGYMIVTATPVNDYSAPYPEFRATDTWRELYPRQSGSEQFNCYANVDLQYSLPNSFQSITFEVHYPNLEPDNGGSEGGGSEGGGSEGGGSEGGGSSGGSYALESSLQSFISQFTAFSNGFATFGRTWANVEDSKVSNIASIYQLLNTNLPSIKSELHSATGLLEAINRQQINNQETLADGIMSINNKQDISNTNTLAINQNLLTTNQKIDESNSLLNDNKNFLNLIYTSFYPFLNSLASTNSSIDSTLSGMNGTLSSVDSNTSSIKDDIGSIKETLTGDSSLPSQSSPEDSLPSNSSFTQSIKSKLLPNYSFFTPSGDVNPSYTFTLDLSHFGMSDFTFTLGGQTWNTVAQGKLVWLQNFIRTLSKFAFYLLFLRSVILTLRQW